MWMSWKFTQFIVIIAGGYNMDKKTIGFVGTGVMGKSMAFNLQKNGYSLNVFTRTKHKANELIKNGAVWMDSVADLAASSDIIITIIGTPEDVKSIYFGNKGIINNAKKGSYLIDMTTSQPSLAVHIYNEAKQHELYALDAPVSGGDIGARDATLSIMAGGDESAFNYLLPIFQVMGNNITLQGKAGAGQHTKLVNQISIAPAMIGICEAIMYAKKANLNPTKVLDAISTGAAGSWSLSNLAPRMILGDFEPGFMIKHFVKDMKIAVESAEELDLTTPGLKLALDMYKQLEAQGHGEDGIHSLLNYFETY